MELGKLTGLGIAVYLLDRMWRNSRRQHMAHHVDSMGIRSGVKLTMNGDVDGLAARIRKIAQDLGREDGPSPKLLPVEGLLDAAKRQPIAPDVPPTQKVLEVPKTNKWLEVIRRPCVVLILGKRGSGKSALGYYLLEVFEYASEVYVVGAPQQARTLLPDWIGIVEELAEAPLKSTVLIDEAYLQFHARESARIESVQMSQILSLSRQREQTLIFVSQQARYVDKNIAATADVIVVKEPEPLFKFERTELNQIVPLAAEKFKTISGDKRRWSFVYSPAVDFIGMLENQLPSFWSTRLSRMFATGVGIGRRKARQITREEKKARARELASQNIPFRRICRELGVSDTTIHNYVKGYPHKG